MGEVSDNSDHVVIKNVPNVGVATMPEGRSHSMSSKGPLEAVDLGVIDRPFVSAGSCHGSVVSHVGDIVARLVDLHFLGSEDLRCASRIGSFWASRTISSWNTSTPVIAFAHVIFVSSI